MSLDERIEKLQEREKLMRYVERLQFKLDQLKCEDPCIEHSIAHRYCASIIEWLDRAQERR